jgi:hypothetical protein
MAIVLFVGPFIIAKNLDGDEAGMAYWKWWFICVLISFAAISLTKSIGIGLVCSILTILYGVTKSGR